MVKMILTNHNDLHPSGAEQYTLPLRTWEQGRQPATVTLNQLQVVI